MFVKEINLKYKRKTQQMQSTDRNLTKNLGKTTKRGQRQQVDKAGM